MATAFKRIRFRILGTVLVLGALLNACEVESPERILRAPIVSDFSPRDRDLDSFVGDTLSFSLSAIDPDDESLSFYYTMGGVLIAEGPMWEYVVDDTGSVVIEGHVANRDLESTVRWKLERMEPLNQPPVIVEVKPPESNAAVVVGDEIEFSMTASDPEGQPLSYAFTVDDTLRSASNRFTFRPFRVGEVTVRCVAWDGEDNGFVSFEWDVRVFAEPDSILPAPVMMQSLETGTNTGELIVRWIAVGDDDMQGLPSHYVVRTLGLAIDSEPQWVRASERPGEPAPAAPGQLMEMRIQFLNPADFVYVTVRAVDDFGNLSPLGNTLGAESKGNDVHVTVMDALTGQPLPDIHVESLGDEGVTDANGQFSFTHLPNGSARIGVRDEDGTGFGNYFDQLTDPIPIVDEAAQTLWMIPNVPVESQDYSSFLTLLRRLTDVGGTYYYLLRNWGGPVDVYVEPHVGNGLDYVPDIMDAIQMWEDVTGLDLFTVVDQRPEEGVYVTYSSSITRDIYEVIRFGYQQQTILGRVTLRTSYTPEISNTLYRTAAHELGHALGFGHSTDAIHMMVGGRSVAVDLASPDEINLMKVMYRMPRHQSLQWYLWD